MRSPLILILLSVFFLSDSAAFQQTGDLPMIVATHVPAWNVHMGSGTNGNYGDMPVDSIDFSTMTHYISFSARLDTNGSSILWGNIVTSRRKPLNDRIHAAGKPALLCLGGAGSDGFFTTALSPENRETTINTILDAVRTYEYDGIDWDWEPFGNGDSTILFPVLRALYDSFQTMNAAWDSTKHPILTADINPAGGLSRALIWTQAAPYLEFLNIMSYAKIGSWTQMVYYDYAPYSRIDNVIVDRMPGGGQEMATAQRQSLQMIDAGFPPEKIVAGINFMAGMASGGDGTWTGGATWPRQPWATAPSFRADYKFDAFYEDYLDTASAAIRHWDDTAKVYFLSIDKPGSADDKFIGYAGGPGEDSTLYYHIKLAKELGIGGIMIWNLSESYLSTGRFPDSSYPNLERNWLTHQMRKHLLGIGSPPDTIPPSVNFVTPSEGDSLRGMVAVEATASDNEGVSAVEFFVDGVSIGGPDISVPYGIVWDTDLYPDTIHTLTAVATDGAGLKDSASITVLLLPPLPPLDTIPPSVSFVTPSDGDSLIGTVTVEASASDNVGVSFVEFYLDTFALGSPDSSAPYSFGWDTDVLPDGDYTLSAVAYDTTGLKDSALITVHLVSPPPQPPPPDTIPPSVSFVTPSDGDSLIGTVTVEASASDNVGVSFVEFFLDTVALGSPDSTAPYSFEWNTDSHPDGDYALLAVGYDTSGLIDTATITVHLISPPPPNTPPAFSADTMTVSNGTVGQNFIGSIAGTAIDNDGDSLTYSRTGGPAWLIVDGGGGLSGTPGSGDVGLNVFTVHVEDGKSGSDDAVLTIVVDSASAAGGPVSIAGAWTEGLAHGVETGTGRMLVFLAHAEHNAPNISLNSVTYGGQPMTRVIEEVQGTGWSAYTVAFVLDEAGISAASGGTFTPVWSTTPSRTPAFSSVFLTGVNQGVPLGASAANGQDGSATVSTAPLPTSSGDMVFVAGTCGNSGTYSVNNGFTLGDEQDIPSADAVSGYKAATGADETPSVTHSNANRQAVIGFVVRAENAGPPPPNTPPSFSADTVTGPNGTAGQNYTGSIAGSATDSDGDPLTYSGTGGPGWLSVAPDGALSGTPGSGDVGLNVFTVHVEDGNSGSDNAVLTIIVDSASTAGGPVSIAGNWTEGLTHGAEAGTGRLLVFMAHVEHDAPTISLNAVTYGGQPMIRVIEEVQGTGWSAYTAAFILDEAGIAAASGGTFNPVWSTATSRPPGYSSVFLTGVDQSAPIGASAANGENSTATISTGPLPTSNGDMVFVAATSGNPGTYTLNNGFTVGDEQGMQSSDAVSGYKAASGVNETPSATHSNGNRQAIIGFVVRSVPGSIPSRSVHLAAPEPSAVPDRFRLNQNYPNPFNPVTTISYALPSPEDVRVTVYNALGREVAVLVDEVQEAGVHSVSFDAGRLASGVYTYRITAGRNTAMGRMLLLK